MHARVVRSLIGIAVVVGLSLATTASAMAECDGPFPSFRQALETADRVIVGRVNALPDPDPERSDGRTSRFVLSGWSVLEGDAPVDVIVDSVMAQPCAGPISARPGDQIVIAFGGLDFTPPVEVNAVTWLSGQPQVEGLEAVSLDELYASVGRAPPAIQPAEPTSGPSIWGTALALVIGIGVALVVAGAVARRFAR